MKPIRRLRAYIAWPLMALMLSLTLPAGYARAAVVGTDRIIAQADAADHSAKVKSFLGRDDITRQMIDLGLDPEEASARIHSLSDAELAQLAARIDSLPAGQGGGSAVVLLLLIIILILIFPFR